MPENQQQQQTQQKDPWEGKSPEEIRNIVTDVIRTRDEIKSKYNTAAAELEVLRKAQQERDAKEAQSKEQIEKQNLEQQGKYQEALKLTENKWNQKYENLRTSAAQRLVPLAINKAASQIENLTKEAMSDLPDILAKHIDINPETLEVYVKGEDGKPATEKDSMKPVSVEGYVKEFVTKRPYLLKSSMPVSHGQTGQDGKPMTMEMALSDPKLAAEWAKNDPQGFQRAMEDRHRKTRKPNYSI